MSRGAERTTRQLTDQQLAQQNQLISQSNQEGGQDRSLLLPTIQSLLSSTGYTPQQQSDITQQSLGAANTAYDALRESAANHAAATNDRGGLRRPDRAARPRASADRREHGAARSNRVRESGVQRAAGRAQRAQPDLRHRHESARQSHGRAGGTAQRTPARFDGIVHGRAWRAGRTRLRHRFAVWVESD